MWLPSTWYRSAVCICDSCAVQNWNIELLSCKLSTVLQEKTKPKGNELRKKTTRRKNKSTTPYEHGIHTTTWIKRVSQRKIYKKSIKKRENISRARISVYIWWATYLDNNTVEFIYLFRLSLLCLYILCVRRRRKKKTTNQPNIFNSKQILQIKRTKSSCIAWKATIVWILRVDCSVFKWVKNNIDANRPCKWGEQIRIRSIDKQCNQWTSKIIYEPVSVYFWLNSFNRIVCIHTHTHILCKLCWRQKKINFNSFFFFESFRWSWID